MPSTVTHTYFSKDVYERLNKKTKDKINTEYLKVFSQGPDVLFFHNSFNFKESKALRRLGVITHKNKTRLFFNNLITYIKDNKLTNNKEVISLLYGFILHYTLDYTIHPFVIYKTGKFDRKDKRTYKYNGLHNDMEVFFDCYLINNYESMPPKKFNINKFCFPIDNFSKETILAIDNVFKTTFKKNNIGNEYLKSYIIMKKLYRLLRYDRYGFKRKIYNIIDFITPKHVLNKKNIAYSMKYKRKIHYMNLEKKEWNHPIYKQELYNYSLIELYDIAIKKAINIIERTNDLIFNKKSMEDINNIFQNLSYTTGKDCELKIKEKYFEF